MTDTERAIASLYYRMVYQNKVMTVGDVPTTYQKILEQYRREVEKK